jgi:hypothetical protein
MINERGKIMGNENNYYLMVDGAYNTDYYYNQNNSSFSASIACSGAAFATLVSMYYSDPKFTLDFVMDNFWTNEMQWYNDVDDLGPRIDSEIFVDASVDTTTAGFDKNNIEYKNDMEEFTSYIVYYLTQGKPVMVCVNGSERTHYVTVVGVNNSDLSAVTFNDLVIIDPDGGKLKNKMGSV